MDISSALNYSSVVFLYVVVKLMWLYVSNYCLPYVYEWFRDWAG